MKILVIGSGGREHALAWKLAQSPRVQQVYVAPGNGGTQMAANLKNVPITDVAALRDWALAEKIALTVVGPEQPLAAGVVDDFRAHGLRIFGPTRAAAQLESSKAFSKDFMRRHGIPTAAYETFTDAAAARAYVDRLGAPIVVKADGLAAGKGVVVAQTVAEAHAAIDDMLGGNQLGVAHNEGGARVVIEEFLQGEEASFIVLSDGRNVVALASSQDHKRLKDGDEGPNTGGMGAYSPAPVVTADVHARAMREVILPTIRGMDQDGVPFTGFLYAGLMIDAEGRPKTLEFNTRMGDPETQPILMRLKTDLVEVLLAATAGKLDEVELQWDRRVALGVVLAAGGYPLAPKKGDLITGLPAPQDDAMVFHAGTVAEGGQLRTAGGRVLCVTVLADSVKQAQTRAYDIARVIHFDGVQYRRDIGHRALKPGNPDMTELNAQVRDYLTGLQARITGAIAAADGQASFLRDDWHKAACEPLQGEGITQILEGGAVFERAGVGFSCVRGAKLPPSATQHRPELAGAPFEAMGVSLVFHPLNPYVPTVHMNVRMLSAGHPGEEPVRWFGGGMDLTPYYGFDEDCVHFHTVCRDALAPLGGALGGDLYARFKPWCDEYFFNRHRGEARGIGGIFYDDFAEGGPAHGFALTRAVGDAFLQAYLPIVQRRAATPWGERERQHQLHRRGRYVEFNLVWDRGTHFGLQSGGRTESILLSMPPLVAWQYQRQSEAGSPEARLTEHFLVPRAWV